MTEAAVKTGKKRTKVENPDLAGEARETSSETAEALGEVLAERSEEAAKRLSRVREIKTRDIDTTLELAEQLYEIHNKGLWHHMTNPHTEKPYASFQEFMRHEVDRYDTRAGEYLVAVWTHYVIKEGNGERHFLDSVKHLGWSKLAIMIGFLTSKNEKKVISEITNSDGTIVGKREITERVKKAKAKAKAKSKGKSPDKGPSPTDKKPESPTKWSCSVFKRQRENIDLAVKKAKDMRETNSDSEALEIMALDFLSMHSENDAALADVFRGMEHAIGGTVLAFKRDDVLFTGKGTKLEKTKKGRMGQLFRLLEDRLGASLTALRDGKIAYTPGVEADATETDILASHLASLEATLGIRLIAHKEGAGFVYGSETLKRLASE